MKRATQYLALIPQRQRLSSSPSRLQSSFIFLRVFLSFLHYLPRIFSVIVGYNSIIAQAIELHRDGNAKRQNSKAFSDAYYKLL